MGRERGIDIDIPILGSKAYSPSELLLITECPECGFPVFAHTATGTQETTAYPTCDHVEGVSAINEIPPYDPDRERQTISTLFSLVHNLRAIIVDYTFKFGGLDEEAEEPVEVEYREIYDAPVVA